MHRQAYILLVLATLFWGGNAVAGKMAVGQIGPFALNFLRWLLMVLVLAPFAWPHLKREWPVVRGHLPLLLTLGALGFTGFAALMYKALEYTSAINASIEQAAIPMLIIILNFVLFRQRATGLQILGFTLSLCGVALTASQGDLQRLAQLDINLGDFIMLFAVLGYAAYTVGLKHRPALHWMTTATVLAIGATLAAIPFLIWEIAERGPLDITATGWLLVLYAVVFPSIMSQIFYIRGNELIGGNRAGLFVNLVPIFGTLLSIIVLGETLHLYHGIALGLVLAGITIAEWSGRRAEMKKPA